VIKGTCENPNCTVAETGRCLLHGEPSACEHFHPLANEASTVVPVSSENLPQSEQVAAAIGIRRFHAGNELGLCEAAQLMRSRYVHLVGVLGRFDAGKTCLLTSLYLLASGGFLQPRYAFAGSLTLPGFEGRSRRLRRWPSGPLPQQLVEHTNLSDPRSPALVHLALRQCNVSDHRIDLLITDLPGEWTDHLVDRAATANRWSFLRRADAIVIAIDGTLLTGSNRHLEQHRAELLLLRLSQDVCVDASIPLILAVSKSDLLEMRCPDPLRDLEQNARALGFSPTCIMTAAFSKKPDSIPHGTGIREMIDTILTSTSRTSNVEKSSQGARSFHLFRC
jgi:GTPase SAR1 family protein